MNTKKFSHITHIVMLILTLIIFSMNIRTPMFDDDLYLASTQNVRSLFEQAYVDYFNWNGRVVGQTIWRILVSSNVYITSTIVSIGVFGLVYLVNRNSKNNSSLIVSFSFLFLFAPSIGQTLFWRAGVGNYLFTTLLILTFISKYTRWYHEDVESKFSVINWIFFPWISFFAGWSNENTGGGGLLIVLCYIALGIVLKHKKIEIWQIVNLFIYLSGYILLVIAPGNKIRTRATMPEAWFSESIYQHFVTGFVAVTKSMMKLYTPLILVIIILGILVFIYQGKKKLIEPMIWVFSGIATIYVLSFSPLGQDGGRAFFGGIIFLIISLMTMFRQLVSDTEIENSIRSKVVFFRNIIVLISILFSIYGVYDFYKSTSAINERYIKLNKLTQQQRRKVIRVKPLSYNPKTKFSVNYGLEEIKETKDFNDFPNKGYKIHFNLKGICLK